MATPSAGQVFFSPLHAFEKDKFWLCSIINIISQLRFNQPMTCTARLCLSLGFKYDEWPSCKYETFEQVAEEGGGEVFVTLFYSPYLYLMTDIYPILFI